MHPCRPSKILYYLISAKYDLENIFSKFCFSGPPMICSIVHFVLFCSFIFIYFRKDISINKGIFFFKIWSKSNLQNMLAGSNNICLLLRFVLYFLLKPNFAYNFTQGIFVKWHNRSFNSGQAAMFIYTHNRQTYLCIF